ncbi:MAG: hypothetical protein JWM59_2440 [Verrucomicrobiales bacterium]|nr:hypothetical protein [Verrucomicrobiales bacterium]
MHFGPAAVNPLQFLSNGLHPKGLTLKIAVNPPLILKLFKIQIPTIQLPDMPKKTMFCLAGSRNLAELIVDGLKCRGFTDQDVSALYLDNDRNTKRAHHFTYAGPEPAENNPAAPTDMAGSVGGALGWIAGIRVFTVPETGLFIAAGVCMAPFFSHGPVNDACGIVDGLIRMGVSETQARYYGLKVRLGNILIAAHTECILKAKEARVVFLGARACNICFTDDALHRQPVDSLPGSAVGIVSADRQLSLLANWLRSSALPKQAPKAAVMVPH